MGVNLFGVVNGLRSFLPAMIEAGEGHVVITAVDVFDHVWTINTCILRL